ncbi:MoxR-like ATPase [Actinocorallia herbida]|uniref:MoxR-like ATPase n=1 Tax=Actinocorallia herbida TaxID=58109 RepID=A0A3N1DBC2_9ACTN|nr:MoxR family ATPase [Actinocorallia herbida]ROO90810.1 MoxR-like ATPase [Actinocorallia herbida]
MTGNAMYRTDDELTERVERFKTGFEHAVRGIAEVVQGKEEQIRLALTAVFAGGHLLIEDAPGVGKTLLARSLAQTLGGVFQRVQGTPDLLPSDVVGTEIIDPETGRLRFRPGPVFANVLLADELNRASPKTQSALLEVMEERQVTVGTATHEVPSPFLVIATQNPADFESTYTLPDAQLDRFMIRLSLRYPDPEAEIAMLRGHRDLRGPGKVARAIPEAEIRDYQETCRRVHLSDFAYTYIVELTGRTRTMEELERGASPRAGIALMRAAQVRAASEGRAGVTPDDVQDLAPAVLGHRLVIKPDFAHGSFTAADAVAKAVRAAPTASSSGWWSA